MHSKQCLKRGSDNTGGSREGGICYICEEKEEVLLIYGPFKKGDLCNLARLHISEAISNLGDNFNLS